MAVLVTECFGVFLCDERTGKVLDSRLMPKDVQVVAERLASVQKGTLLDKERELAALVDGNVAVTGRGSRSWKSWNCLIRHTSRPKGRTTT